MSGKIKVGIDAGEWYPVYTVVPAIAPYGPRLIEVDQATLDWWTRAHDDFTAAQESISNALGVTS